MITFLVNEPYIDNFKSLKLKSQIIKEFVYQLVLSVILVL